MEPTLSDYMFELPEALIAQAPSDEPTAARLMVVGRGVGFQAHRVYAELPEVLRGDELLVFNDTRVVPARLRPRKESGGRCELLVLGPTRPGHFRALGRTSKGFRVGQTLLLSDDRPLVVTGRLDAGHVEVRWSDGGGGPRDLWAFLEGYGEIPLPPYIHRPEGPDAEDARRYQTVYATHPGSVAAPTAGLHFTEALLAAIAARGCQTAHVTLHVGPGTFAPVRTDDLSLHQMHSERYAVPESTATAIARARSEGRPVVAVGTTVVRTLEAVAAERGGIEPCEGETRIFIREGHPFRVVDQLVTNFHLPASTLLVLVSAFAGRAPMLAAYAEAVRQRYRFFSYGDGMLIR